MNFTEIFVRRPVLASVVSFLILLFGVRAIFDLPIRQFPEMSNTVITISTTYSGADSGLVEGFITTPIETAVTSAEGIDYMTSSSTDGVSTITCYIKLNFDPQTAFTDIMSKVASVQSQLPEDSQQPVITKASNDATALMYISLASGKMTPQQITDYATRVIRPQLETVSGVASAEIFGAQTYAMRVFLDPHKMAAFQVTPEDVSDALSDNNYQTAAGSTKGMNVAISVTANTDLKDEVQFKDMIVKNERDAIVRLKDIATVELGSESYDSSVRFNGKKAVFIGITPTPLANPLEVITLVREVLPGMSKNFPPTLKATIAYDATESIRASIKEVLRTIVESAGVVILVIFLFLGSWRAVLIPIVTIPLSLIGVCSFMLFLGYSLNLLTLLAMVLAIGLVVDDAIVVVENVFRHIEEGLTPFDAAILGVREISLPIIAMTITLAAVYAPIGFMGGITGALFTEFAFTLASAVIISGIVALSLSPMMCSKILKKEASEHSFVHFLDKAFGALKNRYQSMLTGALNARPVTLVFVATVLVSLVFLYQNTPKETAPEEDEGFFFVVSNGPHYATRNYVEAYTEAFNDIFRSFSEMKSYFVVNGEGTSSSVIAGMILKPWDERSTKQKELAGPLQGKFDKIAGLETYAITPPALPGGGQGPPIQFVIKTTNDFQTLYTLSQKMLEKAKASGLFMFINNSLAFDKPQITLEINRSKVSELGLTMQDIGTALSGALSGGYVNYFNLQGRSYEVIPQLSREYRLTGEQLTNIHIKTAEGVMVPLSTVLTVNHKTEPNALSHFQQLKSATLQGVMSPGKTISEGLAYFKTEAEKTLPQGFSYDYAGDSRQFIQEGHALVYAFFFSILVIFLVLAAQFESYRDPIIILVSVPLSICGALIPLNLGLATINIYTQVGLITLIGLISKHGILMVDFANHLQKEKALSIREAIIEAAGIRLRPILMTTGSMVFGVVPLIAASGAGAASRFSIGIVISSGMLIGTCFTLFVVPTMYTFFAKDHTRPMRAS